MKRVLSLFCLGALLFCASSNQGLSYPARASINDPLGDANLIIQTDGASQPVIEQISNLGGTITYAYQNIPVLAASLPVKELSKIYQHPNVIRVAKDHPLVLLDADQDGGSESPRNFYTLDASGFSLTSLDPYSFKPENSPQGYGGFLASGAYDIWLDTQYGSGSVIAVVDTGTVPNACIQHAVIGAPGFPDGYNATGDGIPATDPRNHWHGTHVSGVIASACGIDFSKNPGDPLNQAVSTYLPWNDNYFSIAGQAPAAKIYPVKVFDTSGQNTSTSKVLDALDHLLTLKRTGSLDVDVVNLSFGGPTGFEGRAILDAFLQQFREEGILVVAAAGNNGPSPNSMASPATSLDSIAVGALDYAPTSRVYYEYLGLTDPKFLSPGQGMVMRPTEELRVADFSSRGPMSDGRSGPDLVAPGMWSFQYVYQTDVVNNFQWDIGTSYAAAAVSGTAALLNAYYETETGDDTPWLLLRNSLLLGADRSIIGEQWQDFTISGYGALDAADAFRNFKSGETDLIHLDRSEHLVSNILANPNADDYQVFESGSMTLRPSHSYDALLDISPSTSKVTIHVYDIITPDNSDYAYWPNSLKVMVQSAKRSAAPVPINNYWDPNIGEDNFTITIEDGMWTFAGEPVASQPMEPGLMKVSLIADYANESPVSFKLRISRQQDQDTDLEKNFAQSVINMGDAFTFLVEIPEDTSQAIFDLVWNRDWLKFPTSDLDLLVFDPQLNLATRSGATWNAPERATIIDPQPGTWTIQVEAREIYKADLFRLFMRTESETGSSTQFDIISQTPVPDPITGNGNDTYSPYTIWLPLIP